MKIKPGVEYTREEIKQFRDDPDLANVLLKGYVFTITLGGNFMLIPWNQAAGGGYSGKGGGLIEDTTAGGKSSYGAPVEAIFDKTQLPPIVKRTPQQRMASLMDKVGDDLRHYLSGQAGKIVDGETTQRAAEDMMQAVDDQFEEAESKKIVRTTGNPYA